MLPAANNPKMLISIPETLLIQIKFFALILCLTLLTMVLNISHQSVAPAKIPKVNKIAEWLPDSVRANPSPAKIAPKTIIVSGLDIVSKNTEKKSLIGLSLTLQLWLSSTIGLSSNILIPK